MLEKIPFPKRRTLWPLVLIPGVMAGFYLVMVYPRFCNNFSLIWQHLSVLTLWLITTGLLMMAVREALIRLHLRWVNLPAVIIPTLSFYFIYFVYVVSVIGYLTWGSSPNYKQILPFVPHLFELADNFEIPRALIIAILVVPLVAIGLILHGRIRQMIIWHWSLREGFLFLNRRQKYLTTFVICACLGVFATILSSDPSIEGATNFTNEPIVLFFRPKLTLFAMTKERVFWASRDKKVEKYIRLRVPRVHNVFLFVVDALRADHLPSYGYSRPLTPTLSNFLPRAHSRQIDLALSTGLETVTGTLCLMTSKEPAAESHLNYTLPDFLYDEGFKTSLILAGSHPWQLSHKAFGDKVDFFYDGSEHPGPGGSCDDDLVVDEVANLKPDDGLYHFFYIHLISVHPLGTIEDRYLRYQPVRNIIIDNRPSLGNTIDSVRNLYDDRILKMDDVMRKVLTAFQEKGYLRDYVAVLTADHGQILGENGKYGHGHFAAIGGMRVPMIFFGSKPLPPFAESHFAVQLDIAPTLAALAGLDPPSTWQGQSLLIPRANPWSYHLSPYSHDGQEGAVVHYSPDRILKYSRALENFEDSPGELYDLGKDPEEKVNLIEHFDAKFLGQIRGQALEHFTSY